MPNKTFTLSFQASPKVSEDIEYLVRELNHENLSSGSMLKTNKSEILRRIVTVGLNAEIRKLRDRKIAELNAVVGNSGDPQIRGVEITNADITNPNMFTSVPQARYKQAQEAYSHDGCK
tara:strand:+ start:1646 stop:2002 length:357 start_codon:yes stop_codon:yes gene_type:complete